MDHYFFLRTILMTVIVNIMNLWISELPLNSLKIQLKEIKYGTGIIHSKIMSLWRFIVNFDVKNAIHVIPFSVKTSDNWGLKKMFI